TFCSKTAAQLAQLNPWTRYTLCLSAASLMRRLLLMVHHRYIDQLTNVVVVDRVEHHFALPAVFGQTHLFQQPQMMRSGGDGGTDDMGHIAHAQLILPTQSVDDFHAGFIGQSFEHSSDTR